MERFLKRMRVGLGEDFHVIKRVSKSRKPLKVGGIRVSGEFEVMAHSDGDALLHALMDALFGAALLPDIGYHFPNTEEFRDSDSMLLLKETIERTKSLITPVSVDAVVFLEGVKLSPFRESIKKNLIETLSEFGEVPSVNLKFKSWEKKDTLKDLYRASVVVLALSKTITSK